MVTHPVSSGLRDPREDGALSYFIPIHGSNRRWWLGGVDPAALAVMLFAGLNLNAVVLMVTGAKSALSLAILPVIILLLYRHFRFSIIFAPHVLFAAFITSYLLLGAISNLAAPSLGRISVTYMVTLAFVMAVAFWIASVTESELASALNAFKIICFVASLATLCSPLLSKYFDYDAPNVTSGTVTRFSGLFENPNEAAVSALLCIVLVAFRPVQGKLINFVQLAVAVTALALTFSKNGILIAIALSLYFSVRKGTVSISVMVAFAWMAALYAVWTVFDSQLIELTRDQRARIAELFGVLSGEVDSKTTTGRTQLVDFALRKIATVFPLGAGLGEFHSLEGGYRNPLGEWLGVHNTYLMFLGESGVIPLALFIAFVAHVMYFGFRDPRQGDVVVGFGIVLFCDMIATHHSLALRLTDLTLGLMIGLLGRGLFLNRIDKRVSKSILARARAGDAWPVVRRRMRLLPVIGRTRSL